MDFSFLYDRHAGNLFSIGYRATDGHLDANYYDLLASEARLGQLHRDRQRRRRSLGALVSTGARAYPGGRGSALISWSGSMFEYLMPTLVMQSPTNSLLGQTYHQVVLRQIDYGTERGVPWGISESAFSARDIDFTYQYCSFGVPGLGLKRGLSEDLVIAPYATALASIINPAAALENMERLTQEGARGSYGFYESLDYTSSRLAEGQTFALVRAYMAHHQGMSLVSLANTVNNNSMCNRFHATPIVQATELLLQERTPRNVLVARPRAEEVSAAAQVRELVPPAARRFTTPHESTPRTALLSNGRYVVMLTSAGSGYSRWRNIAITRWREDATRDCWGSYFFLRDEQTGAVWSAAYQPNLLEPDAYEAAFFEDHVEFSRRDRSLVTAMDVLVSSEDDAEMRRVSIANSGMRAREIQVTSYAELSLTTQAADAAHPAFANLFVETEFVAEVGALLATRRKRSADEASVWAAHVLVVDDEFAGELQYETDRARFIGRARSLQNPLSVIDGRPLSGTTGAVLDPILSLRRTVRIPPGGAVHLIFSTVVAGTREEALNLADKYRDARIMERTRTLAWTQAQVQLRHLGISAEEAQLFQRLANAVIYSDSTLRPGAALLSGTTLERGTLWSQGISGDLPIILARINDSDDIDLVRQLLRAHEYMRLKQLSADVVIINEKAPSYVQELQNSLEGLVHASQLRLSPDSSEASGKIYLLRADLISAETSAGATAGRGARRAAGQSRGTLSEQMGRSRYPEPVIPPPVPRFLRTRKYPDLALPRPPLQFFNGLGGFASDGREYVVVLGNGLRTPEPWINVIANPDFGFLASESGSGFTWSLNSHENQITPWSNDHVMDPAGEAIYLRDEGSGEVWTPTALPIRREDGTYVARHGQGYTRFSHEAQGVTAELTQFVPVNDPIKISRLTLRNDSAAIRKIAVTAYVEWLLGSSRTASVPYIVTEVDPASRAILARSMWGGEFGGRIAFADLGGMQNSFTCDRTEFLGRQRRRPSSPPRWRPNVRCRANRARGWIPAPRCRRWWNCGRELRWSCGFCWARPRINSEKAARAAWRATVQSRQSAAGSEGAMGRHSRRRAGDHARPQRWTSLLNRWLLYQTLACRVWARAAFLPGSAERTASAINCKMCWHSRSPTRRADARANPARGGSPVFRRRCAALVASAVRPRHPHADLRRFVVASLRGGAVHRSHQRHLRAGGIGAVHRGRAAAREPAGIVFRAAHFRRAGHAVRALRPRHRPQPRGGRRHGLPLIGAGDWNDGMNRVGQEGKGESVWLGWFLHTHCCGDCQDCRCPGRKQARGNLAAARERVEGGTRARGLGRRMVSPRLLRRWHAARLDHEHRMPHRFHCAEPGACSSGGAEPARGARAMDALDQQSACGHADG